MLHNPPACAAVGRRVTLSQLGGRNMRGWLLRTTMTLARRTSQSIRFLDNGLHVSKCISKHKIKSTQNNRPRPMLCWKLIFTICGYDHRARKRNLRFTDVGGWGLSMQQHWHWSSLLSLTLDKWHFLIAAVRDCCPKEPLRIQSFWCKIHFAFCRTTKSCTPWGCDKEILENPNHIELVLNTCKKMYSQCRTWLFKLTLNYRDPSLAPITELKLADFLDRFSTASWPRIPDTRENRTHAFKGVEFWPPTLSNFNDFFNCM